jgi:hypothetical protein
MVISPAVELRARLDRAVLFKNACQKASNATYSFVFAKHVHFWKFSALTSALV